jgi:hypothetical protein
VEEQKEFEIINKESYDRYHRYNKISNYASIPAMVCLIGVTAAMNYLFKIYLSTGVAEYLPLGETGIKALRIITNAGAGIGSLSILSCIKKSNDAVKELDHYYENAVDKDNIEIPSEVRKTLKKYLSI